MTCIETQTTCMESKMGCQIKETRDDKETQILAERLQLSPSLKGERIEKDTERRDGEKIQILAQRLQCSRPPPPPPRSLNGEIVENDTDDHQHVINSSTMHFVGRRERRAAVLVCLSEGTSCELRVILTKRSMNLSSHPGEVALPGGKREEGDADDSATALREAMEEIGLDPSLVQVVANLEPFISQHQLVVVPVVGLLPRIGDFKPSLNADEVEAMFDAPLEMFLEEDRHRCEEREWGSWKYTSHVFDFKTEQGASFLIGGLTASILIRTASLIYQRSPDFSDQHLPDFQRLQKILSAAAAT
ncbi:nudix hydrolase 11-like [Rhododendron vialii]|uniref:nudix hydrolase 11-like n=1 Tax=Rhododendron vialii TaxID=182163 RepID=UPI00265DFF80|nr:nudix hydrolase 11-like [Rhododendron vialii]